MVYFISQPIKKRKNKMEKAFIKPPKKILFFLRIGLYVSKKVTGKDLLPARLLSWVPRAAIGSGVLEMMTAKGKDSQEKRLLNLVRLQASLICSCAFCIDMNAAGINTNGITEDELLVLQGKRDIQTVSTFNLHELLALQYAIILSSTPLSLTEKFIKNLTSEFSEKEIVMLASTIASVNYWARLNQGLGIPPAGFSEQCLVFNNYGG